MLGEKMNARLAHMTGAQSEIMLCTASAFLEVAMLTMLPSFISNFFSLLTEKGAPRWAHRSLQERHGPVIIGRTCACELSSLTETTNAVCIIFFNYTKFCEIWEEFILQKSKVKLLNRSLKKMYNFLDNVLVKKL